jgi:hypothetical protein
MNEKLFAVIVMIASIMILGSLMILGKTLGRDVSDRQAYIQKQFQSKSIGNDSQSEMMLQNFSAKKLAAISYHGIIFAVIVTASLILVLTAAILVEKKYSLKQPDVSESH